MFEPGTRNTGTAIAGKNIANPIAMLNASVDMLYHLGHKTYADAISNAIRKTIVDDKIHTPGKQKNHLIGLLLNFNNTLSKICLIIILIISLISFHTHSIFSN